MLFAESRPGGVERLETEELIEHIKQLIESNGGFLPAVIMNTPFKGSTLWDMVSPHLPDLGQYQDITEIIQKKHKYRFTNSETEIKTLYHPDLRGVIFLDISSKLAPGELQSKIHRGWINAVTWYLEQNHPDLLAPQSGKELYMPGVYAHYIHREKINTTDIPCDLVRISRADAVDAASPGLGTTLKIVPLTYVLPDETVQQLQNYFQRLIDNYGTLTADEHAALLGMQKGKTKSPSRNEIRRISVLFCGGGDRVIDTSRLSGLENVIHFSDLDVLQAVGIREIEYAANAGENTHSTTVLQDYTLKWKKADQPFGQYPNYVRMIVVFFNDETKQPVALKLSSAQFTFFNKMLEEGEVNLNGLHTSERRPILSILNEITQTFAQIKTPPPFVYFGRTSRTIKWATPQDIQHYVEQERKEYAAAKKKDSGNRQKKGEPDDKWAKHTAPPLLDLSHADLPHYLNKPTTEKVEALYTEYKQLCNALTALGLPLYDEERNLDLIFKYGRPETVDFGTLDYTIRRMGLHYALSNVNTVPNAPLYLPNESDVADLFQAARYVCSIGTMVFNHPDYIKAIRLFHCEKKPIADVLEVAKQLFEIYLRELEVKLYLNDLEPVSRWQYALMEELHRQALVRQSSRTDLWLPVHRVLINGVHSIMASHYAHIPRDILGKLYPFKN